MAVMSCLKHSERVYCDCSPTFARFELARGAKLREWHEWLTNMVRRSVAALCEADF